MRVCAMCDRGQAQESPGTIQALLTPSDARLYTTIGEWRTCCVLCHVCRASCVMSAVRLVSCLGRAAQACRPPRNALATYSLDYILTRLLVCVSQGTGRCRLMLACSRAGSCSSERASGGLSLEWVGAAGTECFTSSIALAALPPFIIFQRRMPTESQPALAYTIAY